MTVCQLALSRGIDALREIKPDLAEFLEAAIAEHVATASAEKIADLEQRIEEYVETISQKREHIERQERIQRQIETLDIPGAIVLEEHQAVVPKHLVEGPPAEMEASISLPEFIKNRTAYFVPDDADENEEEWVERIAPPPVVSQPEPPPIKLSEAPLPQNGAVNSQEIALMLGDVTPMVKGSTTPVDTVIQVLLGAVSGKKPSEASRDAGVLPQHGSRWILMHERHVKNLKRLVRAEAHQEYLSQLREKLGANK